MRRFLRNAGIGAVVVALLAGAAITMAAEKGKSSKGESAIAPAEQAERAEHRTYLGVGIESLPAALASHLPETFRNGQGVLVAEVASGSPAEKAGVQSQDILMRYDDQKLFSSEQLAKLVRADRPGREVTLSLIREGKPLQVQVTLAEQEAQGSGASTWRFFEPWRWTWRMPRWQMPQNHANVMPPSDEQLRWQSFDSMTIKNLGDDRFKAEIQYMDKDGKLQSQQFEGTRAEIDKAITAHKDLPAVEREHLLRGLDMPNDELGFPHVEVIPGHGLSWHSGEPDWVF